MTGDLKSNRKEYARCLAAYDRWTEVFHILCALGTLIGINTAIVQEWVWLGWEAAFVLGLISLILWRREYWWKRWMKATSN